MHAQYEAAEESDESEADLGANEQKPAEKPSPEVAKETFYDVSTNLKDLFKTQVGEFYDSYRAGIRGSRCVALHVFGALGRNIAALPAAIYVYAKSPSVPFVKRRTFTLRIQKNWGDV